MSESKLLKFNLGDVKIIGLVCSNNLLLSDNKPIGENEDCGAMI